MTALVRPFVESDIAGADRVLRAAFERETSFEAHLRLTQLIQPDGVLVACQDGQVVGTVGAVDYGAVAYIGLMAVAPDFQGHGLGRLLITRLLAWLAARGRPTILLDATDKGAALYETLGFVDDHVARVFELSDRPTTPARPAARGVRGAEPADFDEMVALDARSFGADRRRLLAALWTYYRDRCLVARDPSNRLVGYLFARDPVLGPWVAESRQVAEELLAMALRSGGIFQYRSAPLVMVPRSNERSADVLLQHGFCERRRLRHMRRGGTAPTGVPRCLFGQSSFAHG